MQATQQPIQLNMAKETIRTPAITLCLPWLNGTWAKKDIMPNLNLFTRVLVEKDGSLAWAEQTAKPGDFIDLRAEMNVLVVLSNCPHVLDSSQSYQPKPIRVVVWNSPAPATDDLCRTRTPEATRGFQNTDALFV